MNPTTPPNTVAYLIAGYVVLLGGLVGYLVSLWLRYRQAQVDIMFLDELERAAR